MKKNPRSALFRRLLQAAREARGRAYAPYSKFKVGAALLCSGGKIYAGCNVENASYGLTLCAERVAVAKALSEGETRFLALAVISGSSRKITPCGACRQFLAEFGDMDIGMADREGRCKVRRLSRLLPESFGKSHLAK